MAELYTREADRLRVILGANYVESGTSILDQLESINLKG